MAKYDALGHNQALQTIEDAVPEPEPEQEPKDGLRDEETLHSDSSWDSLKEPDVVHVVGDIIRVSTVITFSAVQANDNFHLQLIPTKTQELRQQPYINISGAAINSNKTGRFFEVNATQYTTHYKANRALSILPIQAHFNSNKYRTKKPIPSNNTYVSLEGFLEGVETDTTGHATLFHISVDNINFLGKATLPTSTTSTIGKHYESSTPRP